MTAFKGLGKVVDEVIEDILVTFRFVAARMVIFDLAVRVVGDLKAAHPRLLETAKAREKGDDSTGGLVAEDVSPAVVAIVLGPEEARDVDARYARESARDEEAGQVLGTIDLDRLHARGHMFQHDAAGRAQFDHGGIRQGVHDDGPQLCGKIGDRRREEEVVHRRADPSCPSSSVGASAQALPGRTPHG